jgi:hypothetical protein
MSAYIVPIISNDIQCNHDTPYGTYVKRFAQSEPLPNEHCRGTKIAEHEKAKTEWEQRESLEQSGTLIDAPDPHDRSDTSSLYRERVTAASTIQRAWRQSRQPRDGADKNAAPSNLHSTKASDSDGVTNLHSPIDVDMDMLAEPGIAGKKRKNLRRAKKSDVLRKNSIRQSPIIKLDMSCSSRYLMPPMERRSHFVLEEPGNYPDYNLIAEMATPAGGDEDEEEEGGEQSRKRGRSGSSPSTPMVESRLIVEDYSTTDSEDEREEEHIQRRKRRRLVREKEESVESEDLLLLGDRDIVDVLLEQWTVPVY